MISQIYFQSGENTNVSSFFGTKPQRLGLFFIFLQYNHSLLAYQMRKALFLFLWIFTVQTIGAQDLTEKKFPLTTSVKTVNVGNIRVLDPYLSPSYRYWETDLKSTRLNSRHITRSRMPASA